MASGSSPPTIDAQAARFASWCGRAARAAAAEEIGFAESLCDHPPGTVLALSRVVEAGAVRERFRTLHRRATPHREYGSLPVFNIVAVEGEEERPEHPDLAALGRRGE